MDPIPETLPKIEMYLSDLHVLSSKRLLPRKGRSSTRSWQTSHTGQPQIWL
jgi:hypothetical protein